MLERRYYYFISGLKELSLNNKISYESVQNFLLEAKDSLSYYDYNVLKAIFCEYDENRLLNIIYKTPQDCNTNELILEQDFKTYLKEGEGLLDYLHDFSNTNHSLSRQMAKSELAKKRFEYMIQHSNNFIRAWYRFELDLKNILIFINCFQSKKSISNLKIKPAIENHIFGEADINVLEIKNIEQLIDECDYEWIRSLKDIQKKSIKETVSIMKNVKWNYCEHLMQDKFFVLDNIIGYAIKLNLLIESKACIKDYDDLKKFTHVNKKLIS